MEEKLTPEEELNKTSNDAHIAAKKKLSSRKFVVWVVWLVILALMVALCIVVSAITKKFENAFIDFIGSVLQYFFIISMMYLGMNVTQKGVFAVKEFFEKKEEKK